MMTVTPLTTVNENLYSQIPILPQCSKTWPMSMATHRSFRNVTSLIMAELNRSIESVELSNVILKFNK